MQIKCGTIEDAKETMKIVEDLYNKIDKKAPIKLIEFYHMNKALLANIAGNKEESKKQFILATDIAITSENNIVTRDILTERINADLDTPEEHSRLYKIVNEIVMKQTTVTEKLVKKESENYINNIKERDSKMMLWIAVAGFLMILIFVGIILNKRKEKEIKKRFQDIIENLHKEKENEKNTLEKERNITVSETKEPLINEETEKQILKNLKSFEEKNKFLSKDLSTTTMASALKTTPRRLSYILKIHRNSDFNSYINKMRINYIVRELIDDKRLRNYKIAALADLCGYNTHSQFTVIFKNEKGITPSQFLDLLNKNTP